ncbi:MAG: peptide deformylase [Negativicutes bacterium]
MALREIMKHPCQELVLRGKARPVEKVDGEILSLLQDMVDSMYFSSGVGLAAPQIGVLKRVVIVDVGDGLIKLVNPVILEAIGEQLDSEGCLSIPGIFGRVKRPEKVVVQAINEHGQRIEVTGAGLTARAFCHEIDHLEGILFIDKIVPENEFCVLESRGESR